MVTSIYMEALEFAAYLVAPLSRRLAHKLVFCAAHTWHERLVSIYGDYEYGLRRRRQLAFLDRWAGL